MPGQSMRMLSLEHMPILNEFLRRYTTKDAVEPAKYSAKTHAPGFFGQHPTTQTFHHDTVLEVLKLWIEADD